MLKSEVISFAMNQGADLIGFASSERFRDAPRAHHPEDFISQAGTVISFGMLIPKPVLNYETLLKESELIPPELREEYLQKYFYHACGYSIINRLLDFLGYKLTRYLEKRGFAAIYFTPTYGKEYEHFQESIPDHKGIFSHRHAAVRSGLGEFGLNNVVVTPEYGPRVRFNSVITDAEIEQDPLLQKKACLGFGCRACMIKCGTGAIQYISAEKDIDDGQVWIDPVTTTEVDTCRNGRIEAFCLGRCLAVCPVGC